MARRQEDSITILLGIKGHRVKGVREEGRGLVVEMEDGGEEASCPRCGCGCLYRHGKAKPRRVLHSWTRGKRVYLVLAGRRWRCRACRYCFIQRIPLARPYSRLTGQAEEEALWELKEHSFSQVRRRLGVGYGTLRCLLERRVNQGVREWLEEEGVISLGIDEHSFRHQDMVYTITEVKRRRVLGILKDDRIASLKAFLCKLPGEKVKEVCIDMREGLWKAIKAVFPQANVVVDPFHIIADANKRLDEAPPLGARDER